MEDLYNHISCSDHEIANFTQGSSSSSTGGFEKLLLHHQFQPNHDTDQIRGSHHHQISDHHLIKAQISTHPRYPKLLSAYIECRKVLNSSTTHPFIIIDCILDF